MKKQARKKAQKIDREVRDLTEIAMIDSTRLRAALLLACTELTGGDPLEAWGLAEQFYDEAPKLLDLIAIDVHSHLPCGPAKVLKFPNKTEDQS